MSDADMRHLLLLVICLGPLAVCAQELVIGPPMDELMAYHVSFPMQCEVPGLPDGIDAKLEWLDRNNNVIGRDWDKRIHTSYSGRSLILFFKNWRDEDAGTYTCRGKVGDTTMNKSRQLYFNETPDIVISTSGDITRVQDTGEQILTCEALGLSDDQVANLEWLDNNNKSIGPFSKNDPKSSRVYTRKLGRRRQLKFNQVKLEDHGTYTCRGKVGGDTILKSFHLNVYGVVILPQQTVIRRERDTGLALYCQVTEPSGGRDVTVDWLYPNGYSISRYDPDYPPANRYFTQKTFLGSTLFFDELRRGDKSTYTCRAIIDGNTVRREIQLKLYVPPKIVITPSEDRIRRQKDTSASMYCKVDGLSGDELQEAKFEWLDKNDDIIRSYIRNDSKRNRVYTLKLPDATRLQLDQLTSGERGTYTCRCTVGGNIMIKDIQLIIYGKPDTPTNLQAATVDSRSIIITWDKGFNGFYRQRFNIEYRQPDGQWITHPSMPREDHALQLKLDGLKPATMYDIRLNAVNEYGSSNYTFVNVTTLTM
ncbi:protein sidekick-1-like [Haliotis cracherodii]|uniref:protein sidekick-1-like n=1 Tax=Haliotis cracherodii TaxID=6455 RepID=UPI0039ECBB14